MNHYKTCGVRTQVFYKAKIVAKNAIFRIFSEKKLLNFKKIKNFRTLKKAQIVKFPLTQTRLLLQNAQLNS
jgi:hypothetical protein